MSAAGSRGAVLYTRRDCPLCFALRRAAARAARRHRVALAIVDVDGDPDLRARYGDAVPVLVLPDGPRFTGRASAAALETAFREAAGRPPRRRWWRRLVPFRRREEAS